MEAEKILIGDFSSAQKLDDIGLVDVNSAHVLIKMSKKFGRCCEQDVKTFG